MSEHAGEIGLTHMPVMPSVFLKNYMPTFRHAPVPNYFGGDRSYDVCRIDVRRCYGNLPGRRLVWSFGMCEAHGVTVVGPLYEEPDTGAPHRLGQGADG